MTDHTEQPEQIDREAARKLLDMQHLHEFYHGTFRNWDEATQILSAHRRLGIEQGKRMAGGEVERGWLIEEDVGAGIHWIALSTAEWPRTKTTTRRARMNSDFDLETTTYRTPIIRVKDADKAIRFARKQDAEAFIELFSGFLLHPKATEHIWYSAALTEQQEEG